MTDMGITPHQPVQMGVAEVRRLKQIVYDLVSSGDMQDTVDYGVIPGTEDKDGKGKKTLLLPGMEKLCRALNAIPVFTEVYVIRKYDEPEYRSPLFHFEYECTLVDVDTERMIPGGRGRGLCTSMETAFAWRWVQRFQVPDTFDAERLPRRGGKTTEMEWVIEKAETGGKYGKPLEYWQMYKDAIARFNEGDTTAAIRGNRDTVYQGKSKPNVTWTIDTTLYRIPNEGIYDQINSIMKRAKKRALGDAVKGAANVSQYFTVDIEQNQPGDYGFEDRDPEIFIGREADLPNEPPKQITGSASPTTRPQPSQPPPPSSTRSSEPTQGGNASGGGSTEGGTHWARNEVERKRVGDVFAEYGFTDGKQVLAAMKQIDPQATGWGSFAPPDINNADEMIALIRSNFKLPTTSPAAPANKKGKQQTPMESKVDAVTVGSYIKMWLELDQANVLASIGKAAWSDFPNLKAAESAVAEYAAKNVLPVRCDFASYEKEKNRFAFETIVGPIYAYGHDSIREKVGDELFADQGWAEWGDGKERTRLNEYLWITWAQRDGYKEAVEIKPLVDKSFFEDSESDDVPM